MKNIKVNFLTYVYMFLLIYSGYKYYLILFLVVFIFHELGHIFFIKLFNIEIIKIEIYPFGGIIKLNKQLNIEIYKDLLIASGGFIFQLILLLINSIFIKNDTLNHINLLVIFMNVLPLVPLDGSRVLFTLISKFFSYYKSIFIFYFLNMLFIMVYLMVCLRTYYLNISYIFFCISVFLLEVKGLKYILNTFYLERYLYNFDLKKKKFQKTNDIRLLKRNEESFFFENTWKNEKEILHKKFDNCSCFW